MDKKIEIKQEDLLEDDIVSQNKREFFQKIVTVKTNNDDVLLDVDCDITGKTKVKSGTPAIQHHVRQIKSETATWSNNCELNVKSDFEQQTSFSDIVSQSEGEFHLEDPVLIDKKYNNDHEIDYKIEIKEEPCWLKAENSSIGNSTKDAVLPPIKSSRLYAETVPVAILDKSPLFSAEVPTRDTSFCYGIDLKYEYKKCDVTCDVLNARKYVHSNQYGKYSEAADRYVEPSYLKHSSLSDMSKTTEQCSTREKSYSSVSNMTIHNVINGGKKTHQCKVDDKSFTELLNFRKHNLVHEGKKAHQCKVCHKSFTHLSNLKKHNLVHEGRMPHICNVCDKSFSHLSSLKTNNLIHDGQKPHQCKVCGKRFTHLSHLKTHNLVHEGKKPHKCDVCDKSFTHLSNLKIHNLIHEGKRPHSCKFCDKSFTHLTSLKRHNLIHEGKKPHQCKICDKSFTQLSHLKTHNLVHEGKKPHRCKVCNRCFTELSTLKTHNLVHEDKKPHQCKVCDKSFGRLSLLKMHCLIHDGNSTQ